MREHTDPRGLRLLIGAAVLAAACAAPTEVVDERSVDRKALFTAFIAGPSEFKAQAERLEEDAELSRLWAEDLVLVMVASYRVEGVAAIGEQQGRFERARRALLGMSDVAVEPLVELVLVGNDVGAKLASDLLIEGGERRAAPMLARALGGSPARSRLRALTALAGLSYGGGEEELVLERLYSTLAEDSAWICRSQAASSLVARADAAGAVERVRVALTRGLGDSELKVQGACCWALLQLGDVKAVPALINHLDRLVKSGAGLDHLRAAQAALMGLTGIRRELSPSEWRQRSFNHGESKGG